MTLATEPAGGRRSEPFGQRFSLFAECVFVGVLVAIACLPVVTWVAAFAAGSLSIRRHLDDESVTVRQFVRDLWAVLPGALAVALLGAGALALLAVDLAAARSGLPGGGPLAAVLVALLTVLVVVQLRTAAVWTLGRPWHAQLREGMAQTVHDPAGSLLLVGGVVVAAVTTWQSLPLVVPALGCLVMASIAVERRPR